MNKKRKSLLITLPVFNEEKILRENIEKVLEYSKNLDYVDIKILIAEDGSTDGTKAVMKSIKTIHPEIDMISISKSLGRGLALRNAWSLHDADLYCFMDVDLAVPLDYLESLVKSVLNGECDAAIGSRYAAGSVVKRERLRGIVSMAYNKLLNVGFGSRVLDHQCGFRVFSRAFVRDVVLKCTSESWFLDTECIVKGQDAGFKIKEFPVEWIEKRRIKTPIKRLVKDIKRHGIGLILLATEARRFEKLIRLLKFCIIGAFGFVFVFVLTFLASQLSSNAIVITVANTLAFLSAMIIQFFLNRKFTFNLLDRVKRRLVLDIFGRSIGLGINAIIFSTTFLKLGILFSTLLGALISTLFNFTFNAVLVFNAKLKMKNLVDFVKKLKYAIIILAIYCVVSSLLAIYLSYDINILGQKNDYATYYYAVKTFFSGDIDNVYNYTYLSTQFGVMQFRYLPSSLLFIAPFTFLDLSTSFFTFNCFSCFLTIVSTWLCVDIFKKIAPDNTLMSNSLIKICTWAMLISLFNIMDFTNGQPNAIVFFFAILSLKYFLEKKDNIACLCLGLSIIAKPILYTIIPLVLFVTNKRTASGKMKDAIKKLFFMLVPFVFDVAVFVLHRSLISGFIERNFGAGGTPQSISVSLSNFLDECFGLPAMPTFIAILALSIVAGIFIIRHIEKYEDKLIFSFIFGSISFLLAYTQAWPLNILAIYPFIFLGANFIKRNIKQFILIFIGFQFTSQNLHSVLYITGNIFNFNAIGTITYVLISQVVELIIIFYFIIRITLSMIDNANVHAVELPRPKVHRFLFHRSRPHEEEDLHDLHER